MREIKFRAVIKESNATLWFTINDLIEDRKLFSIRELLMPWLESGNKPDRFTGLQDKNGKEIYEGDIVKKESPDGYYDPEKIFVINYMLLHNCGDCTEDSGIGFNFYLNDSSELTVIGNIYENPELLEKEDDLYRDNSPEITDS